jgi:hypothetical protein
LLYVADKWNHRIQYFETYSLDENSR